MSKPPIDREYHLESLREATRKLPGFPFPLTSDSILDTCMVSVRECKTPEELGKHIVAWSSLWTIDFRFPTPEPTMEEVTLAANCYDHDVLLVALQDLRDSMGKSSGKARLENLIETNEVYRAAVHLLMPFPLVETYMVAEKFGVPFNVAWSQRIQMEFL